MSRTKQTLGELGLWLTVGAGVVIAVILAFLAILAMSGAVIGLLLALANLALHFAFGMKLFLLRQDFFIGVAIAILRPLLFSSSSSKEVDQ